MHAKVAADERDRELAAGASRATCHIVKARARHYHRRPIALDALYPGLSMAATATLVAVAAHLVERERASPRRWFGFGGEVNLVNAKAALLLGRALRRREKQVGEGWRSLGEGAGSIRQVALEPGRK